MIARSWDLLRCPKVPRAWAKSSRRALGALASVPVRSELDLAPFGPARLTFTGLTFEPADSLAPTIALEGGGIAARMVVGAPLAVALVDSLLAGRPSHFGVRRLGPAERGLLAGVLAVVSGRLGWTVRLDGGGTVDEDRLVLAFWLETKVGTGELRIEVPHEAPLPRPGPDRWDASSRSRLGRLPIPAAVEIAVTELEARQITAVVAGDAVVFEAIAGGDFLPEGRWPGRLAIRSSGGRYQAPVGIDPRGEVRVIGVMSPAYEERRMDASDSGSGFDAVTVLAGAPIEVVAELGRITLRGDELMGLAPGAVLRLATGRKLVSLRAAGETWAEGEIVDVEGELGVRVTRVLSR